MNARQLKKKLKKRITKLELENGLMKSIIEDDSKMRETYELYNNPLQIESMGIKIKRYSIEHVITPSEILDDVYMSFIKEQLTKELFDGIKDNILYEINDDGLTPSITANVYIGER